MKPKRVALYLRVSTNTGHQTVENQRLELEAIAKRSGWQIVSPLRTIRAVPRDATSALAWTP